MHTCSGSTSDRIEPAPERRRHASWHAPIKSHLGAIAGADFFTLDVLRGFGFVRYWVMFVIDIGTRRVHIAASCPRRGPTCQPCEPMIGSVYRASTSDSRFRGWS